MSKKVQPLPEIRSQEIVDFLHGVVFGEIDIKSVSAEQIKAANLLLNKSMPNLQSTTLKNEGEDAFSIKIVTDFD